MIASVASVVAGGMALWLGAVSARVQPPQVTFGDRTATRLEVSALGKDGAPIADAKVKLTTSVGSFSSVKSLKEGRFEATYFPPARHLPQIAIILVEVEGREMHEHAWLTLPLQARADLRIETKPRARLTVDVGNQRLGPITADHLGHASVKALIPPCVDAALVRATDPAGNVSEKPLDLKAMPFPHAMIFVPSERVSWADREPTPIEVFALDAKCRPVANAAGVTLLTSAGTLGAPIPRGEGVLTVPFYGPEEVRAGSAKLTVQLGAGAQALKTEANVRVVAGPQSAFSIRFEPEKFTAGSGTRVRISTAPTDAKGNVVAGGQQPERVVTDFGVLEGVPPTLTLTLPDQLQGREVAVVRAEGAAGSSAARLALETGPPSAIAWLSKLRFTRAGETFEAQVRVTDSFGNAVNHSPIDASLAGATTTKVEPIEDGRHRIVSAVPDDSTIGTHELSVDAGTVNRHDNVVVGQFQRPWGFILGLSLTAQTNFVRAAALVPRLNLAMHVAGTPFELLLEGDLALYQKFTTELAEGPQTTALASGAVAVGARYSLPVSARWSVYASAVVGLDVVASTLTLTSSSVARSQSEVRGALLLRGALGTSVALGRGRFFGQLEGSWARARGQLSGNLGGLGLGVGYWYGF
jgi:hypothetical protein